MPGGASKKKGRDKRVKSGRDGKGPTSARRRVCPDCAPKKQKKREEEGNANHVTIMCLARRLRFNCAAAYVRGGRTGERVFPYLTPSLRIHFEILHNPRNVAFNPFNEIFRGDI